MKKSVQDGRRRNRSDTRKRRLGTLDELAAWLAGRSKAPWARWRRLEHRAIVGRAVAQRPLGCP